MTKWFKRARSQVIFGFFIWIATMVAAYIFLPTGNVVELACLVTLSVSLGAMCTFGPVALTAVTNPRTDTSDLLALGTFLKSSALASLAVWVIGYRVMYGVTPYLRESWIFLLVLAVSSYGGLLFLLSENSLPGNIPTRAWVRGGLWVAAGAFLFVLFLLAVT